MNPQETRAAEELIFAIRDMGIAVLVIEHDMRFIFNLCDRVACLVQGEKLVEGTAEVVQGDERVIAAYLGTPFEGAPGAEESPRSKPAEAAASTTSAHQHGRRSQVTALLEVEDLKVAYGKIEAVKGISFGVNEGQIVCLVGTNGAGKTTTLRTLSGLLKPTGGSITFDGKPLAASPPTRSSPWASPTPPRDGTSSPG